MEGAVDACHVFASKRGPFVLRIESTVTAFAGVDAPWLSCAADTNWTTRSVRPATPQAPKVRGEVAHFRASPGSRDEDVFVFPPEDARVAFGPEGRGLIVYESGSCPPLGRPGISAPP